MEARLHYSSELGVKGGYAHVDRRRVVLRQFRQHVRIARDKMVFGDHGNRVTELPQHLQAAARQVEAPFDRLIGVGHPAQTQDLGLPATGGKLLAEELRSVLFYQDLRFEIEAP